MTVTLKDIAEAAGVSIKTVSNVINKRSDHYSPTTYQRVMQAASELGYVPNLAARHLRAGKLGVIALVVPDILNPYFADLAHHVVKAATLMDYTVLVDFTYGEREKELLIVNGARSLAVDGIILDTYELDLDDIHPGAIRTPIVMVGEQLVDAPYTHVFIDNVAAAATATRHLIELGRSRIAPVGFVEASELAMADMRFQGYRQAMEAAGLTIRPDYLVPLPHARGFTRQYGAHVTQQLLALDPRPDALFCFNDLMALGALKALGDAGLRVPEDVAVIGIDDIPESRYFNPPLSTIAPDKQAIGREAVRSLIEQIGSEQVTGPEIIQPAFSLIARTSTVGNAYREAEEAPEEWIGSRAD